MEDRNGILINFKDIFILIIDTAKELTKSEFSEIRNSAYIFIEIFTQYYMNDPSSEETSIAYNEADFYNYDSYQEKSPMVSSSVKIIENKEKKGTMKEDKKSHPMNFSNNSESIHFSNVATESVYKKIVSIDTIDPNETFSKVIYIKYGESTIISIIPSTYLTGKIIIRDLLGKHAWLISQHRVLDYNTLKTINHNDKSAIKNNQLKLSNKLTAEETKLIASDQIGRAHV